MAALAEMYQPYSMNLTGQGVRIIVSEPWDWGHGNLSGRVVEQRRERLLLTLSRQIRGNSFASDLMELRVRYVGETFRLLFQHGSVTVGESLVHPETKEIDYLIMGSETMD